MRELILVRHGRARSNDDGVVSGLPPGGELTPDGVREAKALAAALAGNGIDLGVTTELLRAQQTLALALVGRNVPRLVLPELNEIRFGAFEGGPLRAYREWAWTTEAADPCPGDGESRAEVARRIADGLDTLLARREAVILVVGHALPLRYVLDAADGTFPAARIEPVAHVSPYRLRRAQVATAAVALRTWAATPTFRSAPQA